LEDLDLLEASCVWAVFGWVVGEAMEAMLKWWQKGGQKELPAAPMEQPAIAAMQTATKEYTAAQKASVRRQSAVCHPLPDGASNPIIETELCKRLDVEKELIASLWKKADDVQATLCAMNCHCSKREIESFRQPLRRAPEKIEALQVRLQTLRAQVIERRYAHVGLIGVKRLPYEARCGAKWAC
jgi:hypothetical protein